MQLRTGQVRRRAWRLVAALTAGGCLAAAGPGARVASALPGIPSMAVTPSHGLVDGSVVSIRISGAKYGTTYAVAECGPQALELIYRGSPSLQDGCDSRHNTLVAIGTQGTASTALGLAAVLTTSLGTADCRHSRCFLAALPLYPSQAFPLPLVVSLGFSTNACGAPGACQPPKDAWDPTIGHGRPPTSRPGTPVTAEVVPVEAGDIAKPGAVTGPYSPGALTSTASTASASGEGLLRLALQAPGTSWGPSTPGRQGPASSTVADVALTDLTTGRLVASQQVVLFYGASPFVYAGFVGNVQGADRYRVSVSPEAAAAQGGLSQPTPGQVPRVVMSGAELELVPPANPQYLVYKYAPIMYGRSTSALHDVPLLTYATVGPARAGGHVLTYIVIFSHEDGGTGFYPFLEWGTWGRITDIETAITFTVSGNGTVSGANFRWGGEPRTGFPDSQTALSEGYKKFTGTWSGTHPVVRDATGNNDFSDGGTTAFRFQLAPVGGPGPGKGGDAVMDGEPFTYQVMAAEVNRWYQGTSTSPSSPQEGDPRQYALVDLRTTGRGVSSVAVNLKLSGSGEWYRSDLGWGYPLVGVGHVRTVVKMPLDWASHSVSAVQVAVRPASAAPSVKVQALVLESFDGTTVQSVRAPAPQVVAESLAIGP